MFVRKDLLKTKYTFVDFAAAEEYNNWLSHYSKSYIWESKDQKCVAADFSQILDEISEQKPKILVDLINDTT